MSGKPRFYLDKLFGDTLIVKVLESLLMLYLEEESGSKIFYKNISQLAEYAQISKSGAKRILEELLESSFVEEKKIETHASNPPRLFRLNTGHPVMRELIFFYKKARGFL